MGGLQRARRRTDDLETDIAGDADRVARDPLPAKVLLQDNEPVRRGYGYRDSKYRDPGYMARPRIGTGGRARPGRKRRGDGTILWRVLAVSTAALILGLGGLLALHLLTPGTGGQTTVRSDMRRAAASIVPASAPMGTPVLTGSRNAAREKTASEKAAAEDLARRAAAAASGLEAPSSGGPDTGSSDVSAAEPAPTAADFARPAFLEPVSGDPDDTPEETVLASADMAAPQTDLPTAVVPLPAPRPASIQDADARSGRIRSAVTLRSGPRRSASAIGTLSGGTKVTLYSCKSWCEVSAGDKRGFVYKSAVAR